MGNILKTPPASYAEGKRYFKTENIARHKGEIAKGEELDAKEAREAAFRVVSATPNPVKPAELSYAIISDAEIEGAKPSAGTIGRIKAAGYRSKNKNQDKKDKDSKTGK